MVKNTNILLVLYLLQFYISSLWGENISLNLTNRQEPEPESEPLEKKSEAGAAWKKNQEPEPLKD